MPKIIALCDRAEGTDLEVLRAEQRKHAEMVRALGEDVVTGYRYHIIPEQAGGGTPDTDLVVEITVSDLEAFFERLETPEGKEARAHADTYATNIRLLIAETSQIW
jgi:hypothetical protein